MSPYVICQVWKAGLLERTRRPSFLLMCFSAMFLAFFCVPDVEAPLVSICVEPGIFRQGSNPSWISAAIALCGGVLFPLIGLSFVKSSISSDRDSGMLYVLQSMNLKRGSYVTGKFLCGLTMLTAMWLSVMAGAALMLPFRFPGQPLSVYDFASPLAAVYPGIVFAAAFAVFLDCVPWSSGKAGNAAGLIILFGMFLANYTASAYDNPLLRIFDYGSYRWMTDSINRDAALLIGRGVRETGILVPGGIFAGSRGGQELFFHGLLKSRQYFMDKVILAAVSIVLVLAAAILLETSEKKKRESCIRLREQKRTGRKAVFGTSQFMMEGSLLFKSLPKSCLIIHAGLWICSIFAPLRHVQGYLWILMLIFSVTAFSQMGCREHENGLAEYFLTIRLSRVRQAVYSCLWGSALLLFLSIPAAARCFLEQGGFGVLCYFVFSIFIPVLACFLGEYTRSRRAFETVYLLLCFLLLNMPSILFQGYAVAAMAAGTMFCLPAVLIKRGFYGYCSLPMSLT